jgi:hypothetical protein
MQIKQHNFLWKAQLYRALGLSIATQFREALGLDGKIPLSTNKKVDLSRGKKFFAFQELWVIVSPPDIPNHEQNSALVIVALYDQRNRVITLQLRGIAKKRLDACQGTCNNNQLSDWSIRMKVCIDKL